MAMGPRGARYQVWACRLVAGSKLLLLLSQLDSCVEAGSDTSTVALRVVGGDEKTSLISETVKYGHESNGTRTREWMRRRGPAAIVNDRPILSSERMLYEDYDRRCSIEKTILAVSLKGLGAKTDWSAVNRQS
jgi:hypothetical protein